VHVSRRSGAVFLVLFVLATLRRSAVAAPLVDAARTRNLVLLDSVVFVLGVVLLGAVIVWWGRRIFLEK